jgi:hypothetical protein
VLSVAGFDRLLALILLLAVVTVAIGAAHGLGSLFLLCYITPRTIFQEGQTTPIVTAILAPHFE